MSLVELVGVDNTVELVRLQKKGKRKHQVYIRKYHQEHRNEFRKNLIDLIFRILIEKDYSAKEIRDILKRVFSWHIAETTIIKELKDYDVYNEENNWIVDRNGKLSLARDKINYDEYFKKYLELLIDPKKEYFDGPKTFGGRYKVNKNLLNILSNCLKNEK